MAKLINIAPLRDAFTEYLKRSWVSLGNDYSVTDLLKPPRIVQLEKKYKSYLLKQPLTDDDIRGAIKAFVGTAVHEKLQKCLWGFAGKNPNVGYLIERKLWDKICDRKIVGKFDLFLNGALYDWKTTSVWKRVYGQGKEWEDQLNIYAYLLSTSSVKTNILYIIAWYTDWELGKAITNKDYPKDPIEEITIKNLWSPKDQKYFLENLIEKHKENENREDEDLDACTSEEMWEKPTTYAVTDPNPKKKRAVRVLNSFDEADEYIANSTNKESGKWFVEERPGERIRCEKYCSVCQFCNKWQQYQQKRAA